MTFKDLLGSYNFYYPYITRRTPYIEIESPHYVVSIQKFKSGIMQNPKAKKVKTNIHKEEIERQLQHSSMRIFYQADIPWLP
jgi:hypothetical protein